PPVATVSLWEQGIKKEEKKDEKKDEKKEGDKKDEEKKPEGDKKDEKPQLKDARPTVKLSFGKRENGLVYVLRETKDGTTLVTVPDSLLDAVSKPPLAYLDKSIPSFSGDVTTVTLERGGEKFVVEKDKDKGTWKFLEPKALDGKPANNLVMSSVVSAVQFLRADKIVAEKATPELEEQYGLKSPETKVILTTRKDDKTEDWTYLFGKEEGDNVYAKLGSKDTIFQVKKFSITALQGELRDTTLFSFDRNNVQGMKVEGWVALFPANPQTVELERKSATDWKVKNTTPAAPIGNLDAKKAEDLLDFVLRRKVDKFIGKAGPTPQKMLLTDDAVIITLTVANEKEPIVLTVGGETPDGKGWFAKGSMLPNEFFILAKQDTLPKDQTNDLFAKIRSQTPTQYFSAAPK
ncbi:MAG TPA: DUF4340 domain-containing protein, partial [Gemmataceae bacterium]|nr:DUF4340 domain-containing protein [Gemmataceae bacterium]